MANNFTCIGHVCHDLIDDNFVLGGSSAYASVFASELGISTSIITRFGNNFNYKAYLQNKGIVIKNENSSESTIFENIYAGSNRTQFLRSWAEKISDNFVLKHVSNKDLVLFCPIADETSLDILGKTDCGLVGATIQGWLRKWDNSGSVSAKTIDWEKLKYADVLILSYEDLIGLENVLEVLRGLGNIVVVTNAEKGADIFHKGDQYHVPAQPIKLVNPTGAGDVFATAFMIKFLNSNNITRAAEFAHESAARVISNTVGFFG